MRRVTCNVGALPTMKFYHAENSNRQFSSNGLLFTFETYDCFAGTPRGIYSTDDPLQIDALELLASDPSSAVLRISKAEYETKRSFKTLPGRPECIPDNGRPKIHTKPMAVPDPSPTPSVPSITQQTDWPTGFFFFPKTPEPSSCFNPSIVERDGKTLLFVRRFKYTGRPPAGTSEIVRYEIGKNNHPILPIAPVRPTQHPLEQWEDPRAMVVNGEIYLSLVVWVHYQRFLAHQIMTRYTEDRLFLMGHPQYRGNGPSLSTNLRQEKNWVWFNQGGVWYAVYSGKPHIVAEFDEKWVAHSEYVSDWESPWKYGEIRGGTPPVLVGDEYVTFFHSSMPGPFRKRRYYMGAYAFQSTPPFNVTRVTKEPLLVGSEYDQRIYESPCVVFPGGALLRHKSWFVVLGVNDEHCGWIDIPTKDLDKRLVTI